VIYDAVVIGGGLVGNITALSLAQAGFDVASVEFREPQSAPQRDHFAQRVSAISPASQNILQALDVWPRLDPSRYCAYAHMQVWDQGGRGEIHFDAGEAGLPVLGTIIENRELEWELNQCLAQQRITQYRPARLEQYREVGDFLEITLDQCQLQTRLLIGADGTHSRVRELAGIQVRERDYQQRAVVAVVRCRDWHHNTARQRFLNTGPLAFLPLPENHNSIVWSTTVEHAEALVEMEDGQFCGHLEAAFESCLGPVLSVGPRAAFPLRQVLAQRYLAPRVALVGDAAHTIHPLAGQGVNLGILDAAALAEVLQALHTDGRDIGLMANLRAYERWRRGHNTLVAQAMSGFVNLFGTDSQPLRGLRNLGFDLSNKALPVKRLFMHYASGLSGHIPALALPHHDQH